MNKAQEKGTSNIAGNTELDIKDIMALNAEIIELNKKNDENKTELRAVGINLTTLVKSFNSRYHENITIETAAARLTEVKEELKTNYQETLEIVNSIKNGTYKKVLVTDVVKDLKINPPTEAVVEQGSAPEVGENTIVTEGEPHLGDEEVNLGDENISFDQSSVGAIPGNEGGTFSNGDEEENSEESEEIEEGSNETAETEVKAQAVITETVGVIEKVAEKPKLIPNVSGEGAEKKTEQSKFWNNFGKSTQLL